MGTHSSPNSLYSRLRQLLLHTGSLCQGLSRLQVAGRCTEYADEPVLPVNLARLPILAHLSLPWPCQSLFARLQVP
jgi:hypothetical protein